MIVERSEYKGSKTIVFKKDTDDKYPFSFGLGKAKTILANIPEIKKFVEENEPGYKLPEAAVAGEGLDNDVPF